MATRSSSGSAASDDGVESDEATAVVTWLLSIDQSGAMRVFSAV